jgi:hypothetical protein
VELLIAVANAHLFLLKPFARRRDSDILTA